MRSVIDYSRYLKRGKDNAISSEALAAAAGFNDTRTLRADIARSRAAGQIIISTTAGGYYLPADRSDIVEFIQSMEARAKNILLAVRSARQEIGYIEGQMCFDSEQIRTLGIYSDSER